MGKSKITSQNRLSYQNSASKHAVSSATLYGRPDISASDTSFLQKAERYKLFLRVQERQEKDQGTVDSTVWIQLQEQYFAVTSTSKSKST